MSLKAFVSAGSSAEKLVKATQLPSPEIDGLLLSRVPN